MKNFKELNIWQKGIKIVKLIFTLLENLEDKKYYNLKNQLQKSAISIASNIAEGGSIRSEKEYGRFLEISLGSAFELETQLIILKKIQDKENKIIGELLNMIHEEQKMLQSFIKRIYSG